MNGSSYIKRATEKQEFSFHEINCGSNNNARLTGGASYEKWLVGCDGDSLRQLRR